MTTYTVQVRCAWCKRIMGYKTGFSTPDDTHGICPACYAKFPPAPSSAKDEAPYTFPGEPGGGHLLCPTCDPETGMPTRACGEISSDPSSVQREAGPARPRGASQDAGQSDVGSLTTAAGESMCCEADPSDFTQDELETLVEISRSDWTFEDDGLSDAHRERADLIGKVACWLFWFTLWFMAGYLIFGGG